MTDMLRFERTPNGPPNVPEFSSVKTKAGFEQLYAMSAYNHIVNGTRYPAALLMTGANDPRVAPWMSQKRLRGCRQRRPVESAFCCAWTMPAVLA
jgi:prolyl oligopeptidase PreP (S9A serine peptidase family)